MKSAVFFHGKARRPSRTLRRVALVSHDRIKARTRPKVTPGISFLGTRVRADTRLPGCRERVVFLLYCSGTRRPLARESSSAENTVPVSNRLSHTVLDCNHSTSRKLSLEPAGQRFPSACRRNINRFNAGSLQSMAVQRTFLKHSKEFLFEHVPAATTDISGLTVSPSAQLSVTLHLMLNKGT